ncbi:hypothetical protein CPB84DRAFT_1783880, partial [Gymnopilus junonius]
MPPLAGKPPFATDEPDSFYETPRQPAQRVRQPPPDDPNKRTSAYDVYDNYLAGGPDKNKLAAPSGQSNRTSGIGNMLLNMDMGDDFDDSDDEDDGMNSTRRQPAKIPAIAASPSKNAALAAATGVAPLHIRQQHQPAQQQRQPSPQPIAAPRPGYAAPIAALNLARPEPVAMSMPIPGMQQQRQAQGMPVPAPLRLNMPQPQLHPQNPFEGSPGPNPFANPSFPHDRPPLSPSPSLHSSSPHPLQPSVTPITPAFIRPSKPKANIPPPAAVKFEDGVFAPRVNGAPIPRKEIIRGDGEGTLLPTRGEKGDDFWRRFSMVVKEETKGGKAKESSWLRKTKDGYSSYSRWVWIVGMTLLVLIVAGVAIGVYFTRNNSPTTTQSAATFSSTATGAAVTTGKNGVASTVLHVSPTNTVQRRDVTGVVPTDVPSVRGLELDPPRDANLSARGSTGLLA